MPFNPKIETAAYCPVCALVIFTRKNILGEPIYTDNFPNGKCNRCGTPMVGITENFEDIFISGDNFDDEIFFNRVNIARKYVLDNPQYNPKAHKGRFEEEMITSGGWMGKDTARELKEFFGITSADLRKELGFTKENIVPVEKAVETTARNMGLETITPPPKKVRCPRCDSTSISTQQKFSTGKAVAGGLLAGIAGAFIGGKGGNEVVNVCQNCGYKWIPGK